MRHPWSYWAACRHVRGAPRRACYTSCHRLVRRAAGQLPSVAVEKIEPIAGTAAFVRFSGIVNDHRTRDNQRQSTNSANPLLSSEETLCYCFSRENRKRTDGPHVYTRAEGRGEQAPDTVARRVYSDNTRPALSRRRYRTTSEADRKRGFCFPRRLQRS